jgi:hypothetical protein
VLVRGTEFEMATTPMTSGYPPRCSCTFFILPLGTAVKYKFIYIGILFRWWKTCVVTPLSPRVLVHSELGPWAEARHVAPSRRGLPPVDHHEGIFLGERRRTAPVRPFIMLRTPGEGP